jgi:hypothetical protein
MSATQDVQDYLEKMRPAPGQTVEDFAREGLRWQVEIYSANAGGDIPGLGWSDISEKDREHWRQWARNKGAKA